MKKTVLIVVDLQNDYFRSLGGRFPLADAEGAAEKTIELLSLFRSQGWPIVHIQHINKDARAPLFVEGSKGADTHESVRPLEGEPVVQKHCVNSFKETILSETLAKIDPERLVIVGAMTNNCVESLTRAASDKGFTCMVAHDACTEPAIIDVGAFHVTADEIHRVFMAALILGRFAQVTTTADIIEQFHKEMEACLSPAALIAARKEQERRAAATAEVEPDVNNVASPADLPTAKASM